MKEQMLSPWRGRPVKIYIGFLLLIWSALITANLFGFRAIGPNLEKAEDRAVLGRPYTHK